MNTKSLNIYPTLPDAPDAEMIARYREDGYLAFLNVLTPEEVKAATDGIKALVHKYAFNEELTEHIRTGFKESTNNSSGMLFKSRTSDFLFQAEANYAASPGRLDELADNIRKFQSYTDELPIYDYLANKHPKLRAIIGAILGEDYVPYASMALCKPAGIGSPKPWHQDLAYFSVNRFDGMVGVWIALDHAKVDNGCMHVIPGQHRDGPRDHYWSKIDCEIKTEDVDPSLGVPIELPPGGLMIFDGMLPHETPPNRTNRRRRALQFHYRSAATQIVPREEHKKRFTGPDGLFVGCDYSKFENAG